MCGRFGLFSDLDHLAEQFGLEPLALRELYQASYNVAPTQDVLTVSASGLALEPIWMRWGLVAPWLAAGRPLGKPVFNARSETIAQKPMFRSAFRRRRGLVLADGFYEWQAIGARRQAHWIRRRDRAPLALAAIWERQAGSGLHSCAVATTTANELMAPVHQRMPVLLDPTAVSRWLDPGAGRDELLSLCDPRAWPDMEVLAVSDRVGRVANNDPSLIDPI